jgi:hypothetical protein
MRFLDRPLAVAVVMFTAGSVSGASFVICTYWTRFFLLGLIEVRMLTPLNIALTSGGELAVFVLIFANNSAVALLSFLYPFLIATIHWVPDLDIGRRRTLLSSFTLLIAFVVGFFGIGGIMALEWMWNGVSGLLGLLAKSWLHGPIELGFILVSVSEPLRLANCCDSADIATTLRKDVQVLCIALIGLLLAAALEVYSLT